MKNKKEKIVEDFNPSLLPENRKAQFFHIVKTKYLKLLSIGAILLAFSLPLLLISFFKVYRLSYLYANDSGEATIELIKAIRLNNLIFDASQIIGYGIFSLGIAGVMKIIKSLCYDELIFMKNDFFKGIKENGFYFFILSLFFSILIALIDFFFLSATLDNNSGLKIALIILLSLFVFTIVPILTMTSSSIVIYQNPFYRHFMNSGKFVIKHYFPYIVFPLIFSLLILTMYLLENLAVNGGLVVPIVALIVIYIYPLLLLANHLYCLSRFDLYINFNYKEIYRKGLSQENNEQKQD